MDKVRAGFIGTGRISDLHAIEYLANPNAEIAAVCDANEERARAKAAAWHVPAEHVFTDYLKLLASDAVDVVEILLPHHLHCQVTLAALNAGKATSVQKPMAVSLDEADQMVAAAEESGLFFKVFENFILYPPVMKAKELVDAGAIGDPLTIRIKSNSGIGKNAWEVPAEAQAWRHDFDRCGGGPLTFDDGHHKFAIAWHFMGMAEEVHAWIDQTEIAPGVILDSPGIISWKFPGGRYGNLEAVYSRDLEIDTVHYAQDDQVEITGTKGVIWVTRGHGQLFERPPVTLYADGEVRHFSGMPIGWESSFVHSTRQTIDALRAGAAPVLSGAQGRDVLRFAFAGQESARRGRAIRL